MNGIFTDNLKSLKETGRTIFNNAPSRATSKELLHTAVIFCLAGSIPGASGQGPAYHMENRTIFLLSAFAGTLCIIGAAGACYFCLCRSKPVEPGAISNEDINNEDVDTRTSDDEQNINAFLSQTTFFSWEPDSKQTARPSEHTYLFDSSKKEECPDTSQPHLLADTSGEEFSRLPTT